MARFNFIITECHDCGEENKIPNDAIQYEFGFMNSCEWCGSKNITKRYE